MPMLNQKQFIIFFLFISIAIVILNTSCKKNEFLTIGGELAFSTDSLKFDTVFTSTGSFTNYFKIYNKNNQRIKLSEVKLEKGTSSQFRLNVDGDAGISLTEIEIAPFDSIYVFTDVHINPTSTLSPFVVEDNIVITLNGNNSKIPLQAYGQNAHYVVDSLLESQTWINDKPYVIVQSALVKPNHTLTIEKGCRIYMHQDSKLFVQGTLKAIGTKQDSIIFQGDRLESFYPYNKDNPGEWGGLHFLRGSQQNEIEHCILKNAGNSLKGQFLPSAIQIDPDSPAVTSNTKLKIKKCKIYNSAGYGIVAFNTNVNIENSLVHTCALQSIAFVLGGKYQISNCTIATYGGIDIVHTKEPSVAFTNYLDIDDVNFESNDLSIGVENTIITGGIDDEIFINKKGNNNFNCSIDHSIIKSLSPISSIANITNSVIAIPTYDIQFENTNAWDFHIKSTSPAKNTGLQLPTIIDDLDDVLRGNPPSKGCYE